MKIDKMTALDMIKSNQGNTSFYGENNITMLGGNVCTYDNLFDLLFTRSGFGYAETQCIIGALVLSGAEIEG